MVRQSEAYERMIPHWDKDMFTKLGMEMKAYFDLMKTIAVAYHNEQGAQVKQEMRQKFMAMYDHITDQGVAYGSCWGNIHHYGYSVRSLYLSYFLMKDVLREENRLAEAEATMRWYAITNEVYPKPTGNGIDMDSFNTQTSGRIASILMMEDTPENFVTCVLSHAGLTTDAVRLRGWRVPSRVMGLPSITVITILRMRLEVWMGQLT